jgi:hypothetical protein
MPEPLDPAASAPPAPQPDPPAEPAAPSDQLGEAGTRALEQERKARREAETAGRKLALELEQLKSSQLTDQDKALAEARNEGRNEGTRLLVEAEIRAQAAGKLVNPQLAARLVDVEALMPANGSMVDGERIAAIIDQLIIDEPYLKAPQFAPANTEPLRPAGTAPTGARGDGKAGGFTRQQLRDPEFYQANKAEILKAAAAGLITD